MRGALSDERTGLPYTIAAGPRHRSHSRVRFPRDSWPYFAVWFKTSPTWRTRSPPFMSPGTGWPDYTPRYWVPFSSPPTTRRAAVEVFEHASTWGLTHCQCQSQNYFTTGGLPPNSLPWRQAPWDPQWTFLWWFSDCTLSALRRHVTVWIWILYFSILSHDILKSLCMFIPSIMQHSLVCHFHPLNTRHVSVYTAIRRCFELFKLLHCT
jgi:hypothetical protein